jgi:sulfite dehydrogenase (quinone) subunit SoeA
MYMANMAWNSAMNVDETAAMLTAKKPDGEYVIPKIIYSDAFYSETVAYADLILPDTTYLERWTASRCSTGRSARPTGRADAIRQPVSSPTATCARSRTC